MDRSEVCKRGACRTHKKEHISLGGGEDPPPRACTVHFSGTRVIPLEFPVRLAYRVLIAPGGTTNLYNLYRAGTRQKFHNTFHK
eukprot:scaffold151187_cov54-Attheya_sp.AAC.1